MKVFMSLILVLFLFGGHAIADECEGEEGAAFGLCNAYCNAMNCDDPYVYQNLTAACDSVAENFEKITGVQLSCAPSCTSEYLTGLNIDQGLWWWDGPDRWYLQGSNESGDILEAYINYNDDDPDTTIYEILDNGILETLIIEQQEIPLTDQEAIECLINLDEFVFSVVFP